MAKPEPDQCEAEGCKTPAKMAVVLLQNPDPKEPNVGRGPFVAFLCPHCTHHCSDKATERILPGADIGMGATRTVPNYLPHTRVAA